jgi:dihydropteroate synthase
MRFHEAANYLLDLRRFRMRPGTESTRALLAELGEPHHEFAAVQVAGSNGKGSTARMVAGVLAEAGLDVGLYTSPHFEDLRERVRVDGHTIPKHAVAAFVAEVREFVDDRAADGEAPTFFEVLTALACWQFAREGVDVAVLEVGIGGRHDATSVVDPVASAVTGVTLEHTDVLGDTVGEIARDKAAVAPAERPLVTGATGEALAAVRAAAGTVLTVGTGDADVAVGYDGPRTHAEADVALTGPDWAVETAIPLLGAHQARNAGVAAALARQAGAALGVEVGESDVARGLRGAHWPGRFEVMDTDPMVVLDGAHNPRACVAVAETLAAFDYDDLHLVVGAMHDKDHAGMAEALPDPARVVACHPNLDRAESPAVLARVFERTGATVETTSAVESALTDALDGADKSDCVLVTGSLYTVGEARRHWTRTTVPTRVEDIETARETLARADVTDPGVYRMGGKAVHRVLRTRVQPRQAQYLKEELLSLGGECAISGLNDQDEELVDVVLMGTLAQFRRLAEKLDAQPYGLAEVGADVRAAAGIQVEPTRAGYPWEERTALMGILNVTPDSFHDGGEFLDVDAAVDRAEELVAAGADVIDVGGESTNPAADPTPADVERERVLPVVEALADLDALVSVDTRKAAVAEPALAAGADVVNDVSGLEDPEMRFVAAEHDAPLVVMHSVDAPVDPDSERAYDDVVTDVIGELREQVLLAEKAGLDRSKILVDPGLGFGKTARESFELLSRLGEFRALGCPLLVGHSQKSMFELVGERAGDCPEATVAGTALAVQGGADVVRVHDVAANAPAVRSAEALTDPGGYEDGRPP